MANRLKMLDFATVRVKDCDFKKGTDSTTLLVRVAASHAATINGNYRFYRPDRMQDGVKTWVPAKGFKRPVLIGHNEDGDVLGRVIEARYVDESYKFTDSYPVVKDSLFYRSDAKKVGLFESVDWIVENLLDLDDYTGLGYIELGLNITNPDAVDKIIRDEYLNVSVGFSTDSAVCSICHQDWAADDRCEHKLGQEVDGKVAFLICGDLDYSEVSFVNFPADPFAGTLSKKVLSDAVNKQFFLGQDRLHRNPEVQEMAMSDHLFEADIHHVIAGEDSMTKITTLEQLLAKNGLKDLTQEIRTSLDKDRLAEVRVLMASWTPDSDALKAKKRSFESTLNVQVTKRKLDTVEVTVEDAEVAAALGVTSDACACGKSNSECECLCDAIDSFPAEDRAFFDDEEGLYAEIGAEIDAAIAENLLPATAKDEKLSAEARKALKDSAFCGPNRSFPVTDKTHVVAARRLLARSKISDSGKAKITTAIDRKAKAFGADATELVTDRPTSSDKIVKMLGDKKFSDANKGLATKFEDLDSAYDAAEADDRMLARMLLSAMQNDWYADDSVEYYLSELMKEDVKDALTKGLDSRGLVIMDKVEAEDLAEKEDAINTLTSAKASSEAELAAQKDANRGLLKAFKTGLAQQIVITKILTGHEGFKGLDEAGRKAKIDELSGRHVEYLKDTITDLLSELKWNSAQATTKAAEPGTIANDNPTIKAGDELEDDKAETFDDAFILPKVFGRDLNMLRARRQYDSLPTK